MTGIYHGSAPIIGVYHGATPILRVWHGADLIWSAGGSYPVVTMTAAAFTFMTVDFVGYSFSPPAGAISGDILPGESLLGVAMAVVGGVTQLGFFGDIQTLVSPLELLVDGVNKGAGSTSLSGGNTIKSYASGIVFANGVDYDLQFVE
jgi:hypothetical protein